MRGFGEEKEERIDAEVLVVIRYYLILLVRWVIGEGCQVGNLIINSDF
jgi:hypothetical protein